MSTQIQYSLTTLTLLTHRSNRVMYREIRGDWYTEHTSVEDDQSIPEHSSNLNKKQKIPFPVFPRIDLNVKCNCHCQYYLKHLKSEYNLQTI